MKQTASGWVILTRNLVGGFHPQNDNRMMSAIAFSFLLLHPKHTQNDALGDGLFVGKLALAQARDDVGNCGFQ
jgi:hypothetical protein